MMQREASSDKSGELSLTHTRVEAHRTRLLNIAHATSPVFKHLSRRTPRHLSTLPFHLPMRVLVALICVFLVARLHFLALRLL